MHMQRQYRQREANDQEALNTTAMIGSSVVTGPLSPMARCKRLLSSS
jgi:hypothetical protein